MILPRTRRGTQSVPSSQRSWSSCTAVPSVRHRPIRPARRSKARSRARSRDRTSPVLAETYRSFRRGTTSPRAATWGSSTSRARPTPMRPQEPSSRRRGLQDPRDRPPADAERDFSGTVLVEWQNVTAGYDLDALWNRRHCARATPGSASRRNVSASTSCAAGPTRYGGLNVTGGGLFTADQLSSTLFRRPRRSSRFRRPARRARGGARAGDRRVAVRRPHDDLLQRRSSAGGTGLRRLRLHHGHARPASGRSPSSRCCPNWTCRLRSTGARTAMSSAAGGRGARPPAGKGGNTAFRSRSATSAPRRSSPAPTRRFSRVWLSQVIEAAYGHLARWVDGGAPPPQAPYLGSTGRQARNALGLALGGIQLSQVAVPTRSLPARTRGRRSACSGTHGRSPTAWPPRSTGTTAVTCRACGPSIATTRVPLPDSRGRARESARSCSPSVGK